METQYKLGWLPDVPDTRDIPFAAVFRIPRKLPARADLRAGCSPVEDQENLGSCTAQALVGALEFIELKPSEIKNQQSRSERDKSKTSPAKGGIGNSYADLSRLFVDL